ncbi:hypothetical protein SAMN05421677_10847 [Halobacillus aidingensis]|uniref:Uncharacterized protein n=1 Tax=Halobacillus aidingensis TaxID=240303 RepID=A0A1H0MIJ7_HALAD|nr:hypothetical protein SAMN05421677_10847 [Halobacillus aidingensis]
MKIYVRETVERDSEGEEMIVVRTYESKPHKYDYIIFLDK